MAFDNSKTTKNKNITFTSGKTSENVLERFVLGICDKTVDYKTACFVNFSYGHQMTKRKNTAMSFYGICL